MKVVLLIKKYFSQLHCIIYERELTKVIPCTGKPFCSPWWYDILKNFEKLKYFEILKNFEILKKKNLERIILKNYIAKYVIEKLQKSFLAMTNHFVVPDGMVFLKTRDDTEWWSGVEIRK